MTLFLFDSLTFLMIALILFIGAVIVSFSKRYMNGTAHEQQFFITLSILLGASLLLVSANNVTLFVLAWAMMGFALSKLIGHIKSWPQAQHAARLARQSFALSTLALGIGLTFLALKTGHWQISEILIALPASSDPLLMIAGVCLILAAIGQSALFPFHSWLLSSMTAPTPVSALMHAGCVNAGGFLIIRFYPMFSAHPDLLLVMAVIGALSALLAGLWMLVQTDVKRMLACSTVSQMGFMILQCGLGLYAAALAHIILHGLYKAHQFLSAGSAVQNVKPPTTFGPTPVLLWPTALVIGLCGAGVVALLTGKSLLTADTNLILLCFTALAGAQGSRGVLAITAVPLLYRLGLALSLVLGASFIYGLMLAIIAIALPINAPQPLGLVHIIILLSFLGVWAYLAGGFHIRARRVYITLLNSAQPASATIETVRSASSPNV